MKRGKVVPDGWAARHRPIVAGFFPDRAMIYRAGHASDSGDGVGTESSEWIPVTSESVPCLMQVQQRPNSDDRDAAGRTITVVDYTARFRVEDYLMPVSGDYVSVDASPDPMNVGLYVVRRVESQGHVSDRTVHLERVNPKRLI